MKSRFQPDIQAWLRDQDQAAARRLIDALYPLVIRIVRSHRVRGVEEEDLAQEVFLRFFESLPRYDPDRPLENWLSRIAVNICLNALRSRSRRPEWRWADLTPDEQRVVELLAREEPPQHAPFREAKELLAKLMEGLSPEDRLVLTLLHLEERSLVEIAHLTAWNVAVVKMRAFRARRRLQRLLEALERERPLPGTVQRGRNRT